MFLTSLSLTTDPTSGTNLNPTSGSRTTTNQNNTGPSRANQGHAGHGAVLHQVVDHDHVAETTSTWRFAEPVTVLADSATSRTLMHALHFVFGLTTTHEQTVTVTGTLTDPWQSTPDTDLLNLSCPSHSRAAETEQATAADASSQPSQPGQPSQLIDSAEPSQPTDSAETSHPAGANRVPDPSSLADPSGLADLSRVAETTTLVRTATTATKHPGHWHHHEPHQLTPTTPWNHTHWREHTRQHFPHLDHATDNDITTALWRELLAANPLQTTNSSTNSTPPTASNTRQHTALHYLATGDSSSWETHKAATTRRRELKQLTHLMAKYGITAPPPTTPEPTPTTQTDHDTTPTTHEHEVETHLNNLLQTLTSTHPTPDNLDAHTTRTLTELNRQHHTAQQELLTLHAENQRWQHTHHTNPNHPIAHSETQRLTTAITSQEQLLTELENQRTKLQPTTPNTTPGTPPTSQIAPHHIQTLLHQATTAETLRRQHLITPPNTTTQTPDHTPQNLNHTATTLITQCIQQLTHTTTSDPHTPTPQIHADLTAWTQHLTTITHAITTGHSPPLLIHNFATHYHHQPSWLPTWLTLATQHIHTITTPTGQPMQYVAITPPPPTTPENTHN